MIKIKTIARASSVAVMVLLGSTFFSAFAAPQKHVPRALDSGAQVPAACAGATSLSGWYGMLVSGGGKYLSGALFFDGNCNVSGTNVSGGSGGTYATTSVTGTYAQNSDNTFTITLNFAGQSTPQTYMVGVSESGNKARGLESDGTLEATIDLQSQLTTLTSGYTTANLKGAYAASCFGGSAADLNYVTFDGAGNLSGTDAFNVGGSQGNSPYTGTYSVNGDGTFSGSLAGNFSQYSFTGVIDDGISEIEYTYNQSGLGAVLSCVGKQFSTSGTTTANLSGWYGFVVSGVAQSGGGGEYLSGSIFANGTGGLSGTNVNGGINAQYGNTSVTGSYTVNSDNTINITLNLANQATPLTFVVGTAESGHEALGIQTDGTAVATIDLQSQLQVPATPYSLSSLVGTYSASCGGSEVDLNYVTFDGQGNLTGVDAFDDGSFGDNPYTGTYTVNPDGTFTGNFVGPIYDVFTMTGVLENATSEMEFTYLQSGIGGVVSCIGESNYAPIGANPVAATPSFNPAPGAYGAAASVILSDTTPNAVIYYTTNGTTPTTSSSVYSSTAIPVNATTTIQAIAVAAGSNNSAIAAGTYFLTPGQATAVTPMFNPLPGPYNSAQTVTLSDTTPGAVIHCTTDGTPVTATSPVCSTVQVSVTTTIQAIAIAAGFNTSSPAIGTYTITLPTALTPTFNPPAGGYPSAQTVTVSDTTPGAVIHCTTDGTPAAPSSPVCTTLTISATTTLQAVAVAAGYNNSLPASGLYTITPSTGTVVNLASLYNVYGIATVGTAPKSGGFDNDSYAYNSSLIGTSLTYQGVAFPLGASNVVDAITSQTVPIITGTYTKLYLLGGAVNGAQSKQNVVVTYSDGTTSTFTQNFSDWAIPQNYTGETTVAQMANRVSPNGQTQTINMYVFGYTFALTAGKTPVSVKLPSNRNVVFLAAGLAGSVTPTAATPGFNPPAGTYTAAQSVILSDTTPGAVIHYTTNGTTPTASSPVFSTAIPVTATTTIEAIAVAPGYVNSGAAVGVYTINLPTALTPIFSPTPGSYLSSATVSLADSTTGAVIHYTTNGTTPTASSAVYSSPITVTTTTTFEAIAVAPGFNNSPVTAGTYTITYPTSAAPNFNPPAGSYVTSVTVSLSDTTSGAVIYYTTNGSTPTTSSTKYTSPLTITSATSIQAIAVAPGFNNSPVSKASYTITSPGTLPPSFSPSPGGYTSAVTITLSDSTSGATIYYTTNGTTPTTSSTRYTSPFKITTTATVEAIAVASGHTNSTVTTGVYTLTGTPIVPYIQVNGAAWQQTATASVRYGSSVNLGPQPLNVGSWSWTGPHGYTSTSRQINSIPLGFGTNTYVATYTNPNGVQTTQTFTITTH